MPPRSLFPPVPIEEARSLADTIARSNAGQPMRRLDIFHELRRSADSGPSRNLVTSSSGFGLTSGGYQAESLSLTDLGRRLAVEGDESAIVDALLNVDVFRNFFETYANSQVPAAVAGRSFLADAGVPTDRTQACFDLILENGRSAGLIAQRSGNDYVLTRAHALEAGEQALQPQTQAVQSQVSRGIRAIPVASPVVAPLHDVQIKLEIHVPPGQDTETYDAIFASIRRHLIDGAPPATDS